jgi:hypothetical protein
MGKRVWLLFVIIVLTLSTGCELNFTGTSQETPSGPSLDDLSTLSALSTQAYSTPTLELPTLTSTPILDNAGQGGELPTATKTIRPTKTSIPGTIKILSITQKSPGVAIVKWEATGNFPSGFKIVFSEQQNEPTYPESTYTSAFSSTARAAVINYTFDRIYYVRVCRFTNNTCDVYSDLGIFAFAAPTNTPRPTRTPAVIIVNGVAVTYDPSLVITKMKTAGSGKAYIAWTDASSTTKGYRIVYSHTSPVPNDGSDPYFTISDPKARSAYVDGEDGNGYYYRLCRFNGSSCTSYSAPYVFNFPGTSDDGSVITITSGYELSDGVARINWTAEGSFPNGFKIMYSKTTKTPSLSDTVVTVSDGSARSGTITGDVNSTYYIQVCKVSSSGGCSAYSQIVYFTFSPDYAYIEISGIADNPGTTGSIDLDWYAYGNFPDGYNVLLSTDPAPSTTNSTIKQIAGEDSDTATILAAPNTTYYLSVCKAIGLNCGYISDPVKFTTASAGFLLSNAGDPQVFNWSIVSSNAGGYHIFWVRNDYLTPDWSIALTQQAIADKDARTVTLSSTLTTGHYLLRLCTWDTDRCTSYSNTLEIDVN